MGQINKPLNCHHKASKRPMWPGKNQREKQFLKYARNTTILILITEYSWAFLLNNKRTSELLPSILVLLPRSPFGQPMMSCSRWDETMVYACTGDQRRHLKFSSSWSQTYILQNSGIYPTDAETFNLSSVIYVISLLVLFFALAKKGLQHHSKLP